MNRLHRDPRTGHITVVSEEGDSLSVHVDSPDFADETAEMIYGDSDDDSAD